jgi:hypothetical protein
MLYRRVSVAGVVTTLAGAGKVRGYVDGYGQEVRMLTYADVCCRMLTQDTLTDTVKRCASTNADVC